MPVEQRYLFLRVKRSINAWHVDWYARGREATAPAGNEARK
jgi:hypothetical protein